MRSFTIPLSILCLLVELSPAQMCVPLPPTGQPGYPINPPCDGLVAPPILYAVGNPGFIVKAFAPFPELLAHPMFLVIGFTTPPIPVTAPPLYPPYGPGGLGIALPAPIVVYAGPAVPIPVPVAVPLPATGGALGMILTAHTVVFMGPFPGPSFALSMGTGIII